MEEILLKVGVQGEQATGFFRALATGAQGATQAISGIGPAFAGVAQGIQALGQLAQARQSAISAGVQELQILQQQIAVQQQAMSGSLSLADATRKLAEAEILAKTGSQQLAAELATARTAHQQNAQALQAEAAAQQALKAAQTSAKGEITSLQQRIAVQKQVLAGTLSLEQGTRKLAEADILAKTGSQQLATQLAALRVEADKNSQAMQGNAGASQGFLNKLLGIIPGFAGVSTGATATAAAVGLLGVAFTAVAGAISLKKYIDLADTYTQLIGRIRLVTKGEEELAQTQEKLFALAQNTRSGLASTTDLYSRLARNTRELGLEQSVLLRVTETVNKAVALSGVSAASADAALIQFSQGLASGTLRGEELNSVLEQTPRLAEALARGMGKTLGQLRQLAQEGKLTGQAIVDALQNQAAAVDTEFAKLPLTVGQALTALSNSLLRLVGEFDQTIQGSSGVARGMQLLAGQVDKATEAFLRLKGAKEQNNQVEIQGPPKPGVFDQGVGSIFPAIGEQTLSNLRDGRDILSEVVRITNDLGVASIQTFKLVADGGRIMLLPIEATVTALGEGKDAVTQYGGQTTSVLRQAKTDWENLKETIAGLIPTIASVSHSAQDMGAAIGGAIGDLTEQATKTAQEYLAAAKAANAASKEFFANQAKLQDVTKEKQAVDNLLVRVETLRLAKEQGLSAAQTMDKLAEATALTSGKTVVLTQETIALKKEEDALLEALKIEEDQLGNITRIADTRLNQIATEAIGREALQRSVEATARQEIQALQQSLAIRKEANAPLAEQAQLIEQIFAKQKALVTTEAQGNQQRLAFHQKNIAALNAELAQLQKLQNIQAIQASPKEQIAVASGIEQVTRKLAEEKAQITGIRGEVAQSQGDILAAQQKHTQVLGQLAQEFVQQERIKTEAILQGIEERAAAEQQAIAATQSTFGGQREILRAQVLLLEAQGAPLEAIIDKKREIIAVDLELARGTVQRAAAQVQAEGHILDALQKHADLLRTQIALANAANNQIGAAKLNVDLSKTTEQIERQRAAVAAASIDFERSKQSLVAMGTEGTAAVKELNHELELSRAVLTTNDARNIFSDLLDAGSFKKAGQLLRKESKDLSKNIFTDLLFGKKGSFDEPLISNVNGLFGTGDGGILGNIMSAGGKEQGVVWGAATTDAAQTTLQQKFPLVTKQSIDAARGSFAQGGQASGAVFGQNILTGFKDIFGKGIGGTLDTIFSLVSRAFGSSGGVFDNVTSGGSSTAAGTSSGMQFGGGFLDAIKGLFGGGGSSGLFSNVTSGGSSTAAGAASGSQFGGGFMSAVQGLLGGMGGGGGAGGSGGGLMGLFGGGAGGAGAKGAGSWFGLGLVASQVGSDFSKGKYGAGAGGVVGGALGAYFGRGNPAMISLGAQLGSMIGGIFDSIFGKEGRISKEKGKIIKYFEKVFDIDFKKITEKAAAKGLAEFSAASPAALALGAIFQDGLKKGDVQGSSTRFAAQLLGNLRKLGDGADEVKDKLLKLADAANFDLHESIVQINQFTKETGADALTLGNFQEELGEAKKNLKEYGDTSNLTAAQLTELAAAHGNTGSQIVTYTTLIGGAIDIGIKFNEFLNGQTIAQGLAAQSFLDAATAAGSTGEAMTALSEKVRGGTLSLEEAAIELNKIREAAGLAALSLDDLAIDPKKLEVMVAVLQAATEGLLNFQAAETDALAAGLGQKLDEQGAAARFDEFMNATLRVSVTKAMIGGLIDGLQVEALKPFFTALGAEFTNLVTGSINAEEFGRRIAALRTEFGPLIDAAKAGFVEVDKTIRDVLTSLGLWPDAVDKTTTATRDLAAEIATVKDKIKSIDDQLLAIARRKIHVEIDLAAKLESIGAITLLEKLDIESEGLQAEFDLLTQKLNAMGEAAGLSVEQLGEAISLVQQLAANVVAKFQAEKAAIEAALATEIAAIKARGEAIANAIRASFDAQRKALEARIDSLEKEKDLIAKAFDARRDALEKELQLAQEFQRVGESIQQTINQLVTSNVAPISPFAQLSFLQRQAAGVRSQLETAKPEDVPKLMQELTSLLQQMAQLQTPNSRPSPEFQKLFNSILAELEALQAEALAKGGTVDTLEQELKQLDIDRNKALDSIDLQIANARAQLDALSAAEQAALAAAAAGIEAEIAAAQAKADAKIEELRVTAADELKRLAAIETDLLSRQETLLLSDREIQLAQLTQLEDLNITAADFLKILASDYKAKPEQTPSTAPAINPAASPQATATGIPPFLWDSMHPAVQTPTPAAQSFNTSQQSASDIARPERIRTAPTRTESTEETSPREVKVTHEFKLTGKIEITGAHGIEDAAKKFAKSLEPMLEASFRKSLRSDYADKIIREKR